MHILFIHYTCNAQRLQTIYEIQRIIHQGAIRTGSLYSLYTRFPPEFL